jgi:hypothetical protein
MAQPTEITIAQLELLNTCPEVLAAAKVVGAWIWAEFTVKPSDDALAFLKANGYRFNPKRKVWQNPCGVAAKRAPYDPRVKYGTVNAVDLLTA